MKINKKDSIIELVSQVPWNTTTIMVWVHGNELSWVEAISEIISDLQPSSWNVYIIFANLKALALWTRYYEKNMNRCFLPESTYDTYEDMRVKELLPYLRESDYLLDIHNTLNPWNSIPFIISEHRELSQLFDVQFSVSWFDILHPWWSDSFMNAIWKKWICLEAGSIFDRQWKQRAKLAIENFLRFTRNINWDIYTYKNKKYIVFDTIYTNTSLDYWFEKEFLDFEKVFSGQLIAYDWERKIIAQSEGYILFPYIPNKIWDECFCLGKEVV